MAAARSEPKALLALWERALALDPRSREALLAEREGDSTPPATVGAQRLRLLFALAREAGPRLALRSRCPHCAESASFDADLDALAGGLGADDGGAHEFVHRGWKLRYRLPAPADLPDEADPECFERELLARCVTHATRRGRKAGPAELPADLLDALSAEMEARDPAASIAFELRCPTCAERWRAPFDPASALWSVVQGEAERLLIDVDTLARRHGWSEDQILGLPAIRREAYLQLARDG